MPEHEDAQGDLAGTTVEISTTPDWTMAPAAPTTGTSKTLSSLPRAICTSTASRELLNNWEFAPLMHIASGAPFTVTQGRTTP